MITSKIFEVYRFIVTRNGNTGRRLNRNLYVMLTFTERPKTLGITTKKHDFSRTQ